MSKSLQGFQGPLAASRDGALRRVAALLLRQASRTRVQLARQLHRRADAPRQRAPELEFYAESGAPEGALYLDGELVGHLPGVTRL